MTIASMTYRLNRRRNALQKVLSGYMHAKHTSKAGFTLLNQAGVLLSYSWINSAVERLSEQKHQQAIAVAASRPIILVHDNIRMKFPVQSQRADNQSVADNGTAINMLALPDSASIFQDPDHFGPFMRQLKAQRIAGTEKHLTWGDISNPTRMTRLRDDYIMDIIDFLKMIPALETSGVLTSDLLACKPGPQQLLHGKDQRSEMYMLPTVNIDESSYGGNAQVIQFTLNYLKLSAGDPQAKLILEHLIPWVGDQATVQRCRGLQRFRAEDRNPYDRLEPFRFIFGLFHCLMALSAGVFEASRGTSSGSTLVHNVIHLSRCGMNANMNKTRPNSHVVDKFLLHEGKARMRGIFLVETGCDTEEDLLGWIEAHTPEDVLKLAANVYSKHASSGALYRLEKSKSTDDVRPTTVIQNRDLRLYYALRTAVKHGRIDRIEDLLWDLLVFFAGSGNSNYANEVYEFLQFLTYECTPELK